ncbi:MAG: hypothetical protein ACYCSW_09505 [bacterium]
MFKILRLAGIGIGILMMVMLFAGCAKYTPAFHSNKYYLKHKKTALKVYNWCDKNYKGWQNTLPRHEFSKWGKEWTNCANAGNVAVYGN